MPPLAAVPNLERELDELYALPLERFTRARNDLAARLRKAHQSDAAETVRALRKPTLAVWTANRLARAEPGLMAELVELALEVRDGGERRHERRIERGGLAPSPRSCRAGVPAYATLTRDFGGTMTLKVVVLPPLTR